MKVNVDLAEHPTPYRAARVAHLVKVQATLAALEAERITRLRRMGQAAWVFADPLYVALCRDAQAAANAARRASQNMPIA